MSAAARSAAGANFYRIMRGDRVDEGLAQALYLAQTELDYISRRVPPEAAEQLAAAELDKEIARAAA